MSTTVIYYSFWGNTERSAKTIAGVLGAGLVRIEEQKERKGFMGIIRGAMESSRGIPSEIKPVKINSTTDRIILACPLWSSAAPPAVFAFIRDANLGGKEIVLVVTRSGSDAGKCVEDLVSRIKAKGGKVAKTFTIRTLFRKSESVIGEAVKIAEALK